MNWIGGPTHKEREAEKSSKEKPNSELKRFGFQIDQLGSDVEVLPYPYRRIGMLGIYAENEVEALLIFKELLESISVVLDGLDKGRLDIAALTNLSPQDQEEDHPQ